jgi:hypothetical protein
MSQIPQCFQCDQSVSAEKSPSYQQTRAEYEATRGSISQFIHRELVRVALAAHRFVPMNVLAEYPELLRRSHQHPIFSHASE